jgi:hypothetical protein
MDIEDQWRPGGWAFAAARMTLAKHVGIEEAATVPRCVIGRDWSNSNVAA